MIEIDEDGVFETMEALQHIWTKDIGWHDKLNNSTNKNVDLSFVFGGRLELEKQNLLKDIKEFWPKSIIIGCSTAGEIYNDNVFNESVVVTNITFNKSKAVSLQVPIKDMESSYEAGIKLAKKINKKNLKHIILFSEGIKVNGEKLLKGLCENISNSVTVSGGLAGDGERFNKTITIFDDLIESNTVVGLCFYGDNLEIKCASLGGWDTFGPQRLVTKSEGNILFELDGKPALDLYKKYLGEYAKDLPSSALFFPLCIFKDNKYPGLVRTILSVNERDGSLVFAGDIPMGCNTSLMKTNIDSLIDGSEGAALKCINNNGSNSPELAILISCVGRKMVLKQRTEEEIEVVRDIFNKETLITGYYAYGQFSPLTENGICELHNQTMTITTFSEV